ncbi:MAG: hypothetical protein ACRYGR_04510 [Janthinobacterium lividum]
MVAIGFVLNVCTLALSASGTSNTSSQVDDEIDLRQNSVKNIDLIDHLLTLPTEITSLIFENFDAAALSRATTVSKKYQHLEKFTEPIFYQRSDFKEVLPLPFPCGSPWKHSYFLRKGFWDLLIDYRDRFHKEISDEERAEVKRFGNYCKAHHFIVSDLAYHFSKLHLSFLKKYIGYNISKPNLLLRKFFIRDFLDPLYSLYYLKKFNKDLIDSISNEELVGFEIIIILNVSGICEIDLEISSQLRTDEYSLNFLAHLYKKQPDLLKTIMYKSIVDSEKAKFIFDLAQDNFHNYEQIFRWYQEATEKGLISAQFNLGKLYLNRKRNTQDYNKAITWFYKAASQGNVGAQNNIGSMHYNGRGVTQSYTEAFIWFEKAANQECAIAQYNLGVLYLLGQGVNQDYAKALNWFQKAAILGHLNAKEQIEFLSTQS